MSTPIIWTVFAVFSLAFIYYVIIRPAQLAQVRVSCVNGTVTKVSSGETTSISLADISEVKYHYSAVAGFFSLWELSDENGESFEIVGNAKGIDDVLPVFESTLPGFSLSEFERQFKAGDVEDTLNIWKRS